MKKMLNCIIVNILIFLFIFSGTCFANEIRSEVIVENKTSSDSLNSKVYSDAVVLLEKTTGDILFEKNAHKRMYPASITKMLTAILVLENCALDETVKVSSSALISVPQGYVRAPLFAGEEFSVEELLYAMLIPSANDAANVLAEHVSGSVKNFADLMNEKALSLGMTNSHFTNPSGIHNEDLYTTASDLSILARYVIKNEKFMEIASTKSYRLRGTKFYSANDRFLKASNLLLDPSQSSYYYKYATGMKTGFTDQAGDSLVASAKKDNVEFIAVCLNASTLSNGLREKFLDCKTLFDFAFDNYTAFYKDLQVKIANDIEKATTQNLSLELKNNSTSIFDYKLYSNIAKVVSILIIIIAMKLIFFRKKKNRRK